MPTSTPKATAKRKMAKRWSETVMVDGFTPVPTIFLENYDRLGITAVEALFIIHLVSFKWDEANPFPRFRRIADRMGVSETSARNHARSLEQKELLVRIKRPGLTNEFDLSPLISKLEERAHRSLVIDEENVDDSG